MTNDTQNLWTVEDQIDSDLDQNERAMMRLWNDVTLCLESMASAVKEALSFVASDEIDRAMYRIDTTQADVRILTMLQDKKRALESQHSLLMMLRHTATKSAEVLS